jgi:hypothetical protein
MRFMVGVLTLIVSVSAFSANAQRIEILANGQRASNGDCGIYFGVALNNKIIGLKGITELGNTYYSRGGCFYDETSAVLSACLLKAGLRNARIFDSAKREIHCSLDQ